MLSLTRYVGERFVILDSTNQLIIIELVQVRQDKARIGFTADKAITILREEIFKDNYPDIKLPEPKAVLSTRAKGYRDENSHTQ